MKTNYSLLFISIIFLFFSFTIEGFKKIENPDKLLTKIKSISNETKTIYSDFTEEKHLAILKKPQVSNGKFYYESDNKMRWEQNSPYEFIILINNKTLRIKDNGKEQKLGTGGKVALKINEFMMQLIQGDFQNNKDLAPEYFQSDKEYLIELTPQTKPLNKTYSKLGLYFSKSSYRLKTIIFYETEGDKRIVTFTNPKYNTKIDPSVFLKL